MRSTATFKVDDLSKLKRQILHWSQAFRYSCLLDNNKYTQYSHHRFEFLAGLGAVSLFESKGQKSISGLKQFVDNHHDFLFGFLSYDLKNEIEPILKKSLNTVNSGHFEFPNCFFYQPKHLVRIEGEKCIISSIAANPEAVFDEISQVEIPNFSNRNFSGLQINSRETRESYLDKVERVRQFIEAGDVYELNFCNEFWVKDMKVCPYSLFQELNKNAKAPFSSFFRLKDQFLLCCSPERFMMKNGDTLRSQPIKGTAKRGSNEVEDLLIQTELQSNPKERAENVMIVDLVRNDLARSCQPGTVEVEELFGIYPFENVNQMISTVVGTIRPELHPVDAIKNAFPMGSMTGAPKVAAMQLIEELENVKRGMFSGSVGYFTPERDFDFNVVIRSLLYHQKARQLSFSVGGAITYDSIPEKEYEESLLKAQGIFETLGIQKSSIANA